MLIFLNTSQIVYPQEQIQDHPWKLWYTKPASEWHEALPLGNGSLGAMVYGGPDEEHLQINEDTLWNGAPHSYDKPGTVQALPEIRKLIFEGKFTEAQNLVDSEVYGKYNKQHAYQPFCDLFVDFPGHEYAQEYYREIDLTDAVSRVTYRIGEDYYMREVFASYPDQVIAMRITCSAPGRISFDTHFTSPHSNKRISAEGNNRLWLEGEVGPSIMNPVEQTQHNQWTANWDSPGTKFASGIDVRAVGGTVHASDDGLQVRNADEAIIILSAATSYENYRNITGDPHAKVETALGNVKEKSFDTLKSAHLADYRELYSRVSIDIGSTPISASPTDIRSMRYTPGGDPAFDALCYQYGRYLLIASSRAGSQAANLQGIWNNALWPPWSSKYTININIQMNYWPAEISNLTETTEPLFDLIKDLSETGANTAREQYGAGGWVAHHNTDNWRGTAPVDLARYGMWQTGGAWLCLHIWEHYLFTGDEAFLREAYPLMKGAAQFFADSLVEHPSYGWLVTCPSMSPEHFFIQEPPVSNCAGPTIDNQVIRGLFSHCIEASEILGIDSDFSNMLAEKRKRLAPNQIGKWGQIQEYLEDIDDPTDSHSHVSHLYGFYPYNEITLKQTPELAAGVRAVLEHRGSGMGGGWPTVWRASLWARLGDGQRAYDVMTAAIVPGRLSANLFNAPVNNRGAHGTYQIDANFGYTAAVAEMLLQSHEGDIHLLPALPDEWETGHITGLRTRGGFVVDIYWQEGKLTKADITSLNGKRCKVRYKNREIDLETQAGNRYTFDGSLQ
ncbi:glycoside hydrolase N-terminal domain-containing protein [Candidatus Latescibacterota bacterium]